MTLEVRDRQVELEARVARRLREVAARERLARAIGEVTTSALFPATDRCRLDGEMSEVFFDPVASVTEVALETLIDELSDAVAALPTWTLDELLTEQLVAEIRTE